ncbi:unnamed protein product [Effrenium voratum]|nr:unnamed protein product [Effrenium voratum]
MSSAQAEPAMLCVRASDVDLIRPLVPVLSPPMGPGELPHPKRLTLEQCRLISVGASSLLCAECQGDLGIGGRLWDGGLVLLEYLATGKLERRRVLELGSGVGLVGLGCALLGAKVWLTDLEEVIPLLEFNIALNRARGLTLDVEAKAHEWGTDVAELPAVDLVVMADLVYDVEASKQLLASLVALAKAEVEFLMAFRPRNVEDPEFFRELSTHFEVQRLEERGVYGKTCYDLEILRLGARKGMAQAECAALQRDSAHASKS